MAHLFKRVKVISELVNLPIRHKQHANHWSVLRKKEAPKERALKHFDEFYGEVYGERWKDIRAALLMEDSKYIAIVNNFSDTKETISILEAAGALNLKSIYAKQQEFILSNKLLKKTGKEKLSETNSQSIVSEMYSTKIRSLYPEDYDVSVNINTQDYRNNEDEVKQEKPLEPLEPVELKSIEKSLNEVQIDQSRIIIEDVDLSALHEYVPATKLMGMEDWISESEYYGHYKDGEILIETEKEDTLIFPKHLNAYMFPCPDTKFPPPKIGSTGVMDYYLFDGASILPVLALGLNPSDVVLDMCAAPGGKGLSIIQTLLPSGIVLNDCSESRVKRIKKVMGQFMSDITDWSEKLFITKQDARNIMENDVYTKILVDVPCSTDRHNLHTEENNIFKPSRMKERLKLPQLQSEILANAFKLVAIGGSVVYSTCSLSPVENDGVVQVALKKVWDETKSVMVVKDMTEALRPLECIYQFGDIRLRYGHIVVPNLEYNWGPLYFCKIVKVR